MEIFSSSSPNLAPSTQRALDVDSPDSIDSGRYLPTSSSTVIPSSPLFACWKGDLESKAFVAQAHRSKIDRIYAPSDGVNDLSCASTLGTALVCDAPVTALLPYATSSEDQWPDFATGGDDGSGNLSKFDQLQDDFPDAAVRQTDFCEDLTRRLLDVLRSENSSESGILKLRDSPSTSIPLPDASASPSFQQDLADPDVLCSSSTSVYAADISNFAPSSADSFARTASLYSSFSGTEPHSASSMTSQNSRFDYVIGTPGCFVSKYAFMGFSAPGDEDELANVSLEQSPAFPLPIPLAPRTPQKSSVSGSCSRFVPPRAPRKTQHHIYAPDHVPKDAPTQQRDDSRAQSVASSRFDPPSQDHPVIAETSMKHVQGHGQKRVSSDIDLKDDTTTENTASATASTPEEPAPKRARLSYKRSIPARDAKKPLAAATMASFRRAMSIRSSLAVAQILDKDDSHDDMDINEPLDDAITVSVLHPSSRVNVHLTARVDPEATGDIYCAPTRPATPIPRKKHNGVTPSDSPLPILAPPSFEFIPRPPASVEELGECRLARLMEKELGERISDGLQTAKPEAKVTPAKTTPRHELDEDEEMMWRAVGDLEDEEVKIEPENEQVLDAEIKLGIEENLRGDVIEWLLDFEPPQNPKKPYFCANLRSQLTECPDTRWHAVHLFTRYFARLGVTPSSSPVARKPKVEDKSTGEDTMDDQEAIVWDLAVACLASSVKLHRDFLDPLFPVLVSEYLVVSPHSMTFDDLEAAQRTIFSAFTFCLGSSTPGAYMDEIHNASPTLRRLAEKHGNWTVVKLEAWEILYDSLSDYDYLKFPVYTLTGCALILGLVESIVLRSRMEYVATLQSIATGRSKRSQRMRREKCECAKFRRKAHKLVGPVEEDLRQLLGVSVASWTACTEWLMALVGSGID